MSKRKLSIALFFITLGFSLVFLFCKIYSTTKDIYNWNVCSTLIEDLKYRNEIAQEQKLKINNMLEKFKNYDSGKVQKDLEALKLLNKEKEDLLAIAKQEYFAGSKSLEQRMAYICSNKNKISFVENLLPSKKIFQEVQLNLLNIVEVDSEDVKNMLNILQREEKSNPLISLNSFSLKRKQSTSGGEVFDCDLSIIKRDFIK